MFVESIRTQLSDEDWRTGDVCVCVCCGGGMVKVLVSGPWTGLGVEFSSASVNDGALAYRCR